MILLGVVDVHFALLCAAQRVFWCELVPRLGNNLYVNLIRERGVAAIFRCIMWLAVFEIEGLYTEPEGMICKTRQSSHAKHAKGENGSACFRVL